MGGRCVECDEDDPSLLQFDHIDPETKVATVAQLLFGASWERIAAEARKCQLLCEECHKRKTRAEMRARTQARRVEEDKAAGRFEGALPSAAVALAVVTTSRAHKQTVARTSALSAP